MPVKILTSLKLLLWGPWFVGKWSKTKEKTHNLFICLVDLPSCLRMDQTRNYSKKKLKSSGICIWCSHCLPFWKTWLHVQVLVFCHIFLEQQLNLSIHICKVSYSYQLLQRVYIQFIDGKQKCMEVRIDKWAAKLVFKNFWSRHMHI